MTRDSDAMQARKREAVEPRSGGSAAIAQKEPIMTDNTTLKPCPFCGAAGVVEMPAKDSAADYGDITARCEECDASAAPVLIEISRPQEWWDRAEAEAITAWNTRTAQSGVTKANREAAANALEAIGSTAWHQTRARMIRIGQADDHPFVQAFARHRQPYIDALTPSCETKAAYMSEFSFPIEESDEDGNEYTRNVTVPWTTIKEIMDVIRKRAEQPQ